ncbi:hypothetical protein CYMTET_39946 [Cymbomonas tetramitiformis]|uniref:Uncharacterized protein n=1 Tax=Cymbomonas tetramitiformis TaxID=36881 RepID=A0AAE0CAU1_9CHLO|nr:hypothetical protein CYMTET_54236 [Cymbomonas tetramitiformis]KAK3250685.1 hypothetical protein CYMTET_39946 [Cymbomonas tetramitiformis]
MCDNSVTASILSKGEADAKELVVDAAAAFADFSLATPQSSSLVLSPLTPSPHSAVYQKPQRRCEKARSPHLAESVQSAPAAVDRMFESMTLNASPKVPEITFFKTITSERDQLLAENAELRSELKGFKRTLGDIEARHSLELNKLRSQLENPGQAENDESQEYESDESDEEGSEDATDADDR